MKSGGNEMKELIYKLLIKVRRLKIWYNMPHICDNYGTLTLMSSARNILANVLHIRLIPYAEEVFGSTKEVLRCGRSTTDQIFTMTMTQFYEKRWEHNIEDNCLFIDF